VIALGRRAWLFAGSQRGGERAAFVYGLIVTAKLNDVDPLAWARRCARPHAEPACLSLAGATPLELGRSAKPSIEGRLMARDTVFYSLSQVAAMIEEDVELIEVAIGSDTIDYSEMIHVVDGTDEGIAALTARGIDNLRDFLADVRSWTGGVRQYLVDQQCEPDMIDRVMVAQRRS